MSTEADPQQQRWSLVERLFQFAVRLAPEDRAGFLDDACEGDEAVRAEVLSLVEAHEQAEGAFKAPTADDWQRWMDDAPRDDLVGRKFGDCTLVRELGSGGMGVVYEAVQDPPRRKVAVKILRAGGTVSESIRQRFEHEARMLGNLRHPGIAQIYEVDTYEATGGERLPYFVMEYVPEAKELTEYADAHDLDLRARIALFGQVCRAVHFGHQKGVIHRDLKPGNLLVDMDGNPKVIDFGIARGTTPELAHTTGLTQTGQVVGTLPYMSPEQLLGKEYDLDTRSDVYALGVILYELLTGRLPLDLKMLDIVEAARAIRDAAPVPPHKVRPELAGDVSAILLKTLAKDPDDRYDSASDLGQDLEHYLNDEPIRARPPSFTRQLRLFARRHKGQVVAAASILAVLVVALIAISVYAAGETQQRKEAESQRARAEFLLSKSMEFVPQVISMVDGEFAELPGTTRGREKLAERTRQFLDTITVRGEDSPEVRAATGEAYFALANVLGGPANSNLGQTREAAEYYRRALDVFDELDADLARPLIKRKATEVRFALATLYRRVGETRGARAAVEPLMTQLEAAFAKDPDDETLRKALFAIVTEMTHSDVYEGRAQEALAGYQRAYALLEGAGWTADALAHPRLVVEARLNLGAALQAMDRNADAQPHFDAVERLSEEVPVATWGTLFVWNIHKDLGDASERIRDWEAAGRRYGKALEMARELHEGAPEDVVWQERYFVALQRMARVREGVGRHQESADMLAVALPLVRQRVAANPDDGTSQWDLVITLTRLAAAKVELDQLTAGEKLLAEAFAIQNGRVQAKPGNADEEGQLAELYVNQGILTAKRSFLPDLDREERLKQARLSKAQFERALEILVRQDQEGRLPPDRRGNLQAYRGYVEAAAKSLRQLEGM